MGGGELTMSRPDRLNWPANRVVKASKLVSWGAKAVWMEMRSLDAGPEGCYMSAAKLATRLGMGAKNVEKHRAHLVRLGLLVTLARRGTTGNWYPTLPADCVPRSERPEDEEISALAHRLDRYLTPLLGGGGMVTDPPYSKGEGAHPYPPTPVGGSALLQGGDPPTPVGARLEETGTEGSGVVPVSVSVSEHPVLETGGSQATEDETGAGRALFRQILQTLRPGKAAI
jgi:hypothetical protein